MREATGHDPAPSASRTAEPGPELSPGERAAPSRRSRLMRYGRYVFMAAVVATMAAFLWRQREDVQAALEALPPGSVALSLLLALVGAGLPGLVWRDLVAAQGYRTPRLAGLRVFFLAQLGKYLPGGIWNYVAQVDMARDLRVPARQSALASLLSLALSVITALITAALTLPFALPGLLAAYWWTFLAIPVLVALLVPRSVAWWSALAFRLLRRPAEPVRLTAATLLRASLLMFASWLALGLHLLLLVQGTGGDVGSLPLLSIGGFALAWVAGFLVLFAPAGAGVREAALVLCFAAVLPGGVVLTIALLSRVLLVVADALLAAGLFLGARLAARRRPVPVPSTGPDGTA
jgi:hypothetical protein